MTLDLGPIIWDILLLSLLIKHGKASTINIGLVEQLAERKTHCCYNLLGLNSAVPRKLIFFNDFRRIQEIITESAKHTLSTHNNNMKRCIYGFIHAFFMKIDIFCTITSKQVMSFELQVHLIL